MRLVQEAVRLFSGQVIPQGGTYPIRTEFPVGGEIYNTIRLIFHNAISVVGAGVPTNPVVRGGYNLLRNIIFRSARGEEFIVCPGMGMHRLNWMLNGVEPLYDNIVAPGADATVHADTIIDLPFSHRMLARKEDLAVHTARYSHVELDLSLGSVADLFTAAVDATLATTLDIILFRNKSGLYASGEPLAAPYIKHYPQYELARGYLDVESAYDLTMMGFIAFAQDMTATNCYVPLAAVPYSGVPSDCVNYLTFRDNLGRYVDQKTLDSFREERAQYGTIDHADMAEGVGVYPYFFAREGSIYNGYWTGEKSEIRLENDPIVVVKDPVYDAYIDTLFFGLRTLRK